MSTTLLLPACHHFLTHYKIPKIFELLYLGQGLFSNLESNHPFPVECHGLWIVGTGSHPQHIPGIKLTTHYITEMCQARQPYNIQRLNVLGMDLIQSRILAYTLHQRHQLEGMDESTSASASSMEGMSVELRRFSKHFFHHPSTIQCQQLPTSTITSVGEQLFHQTVSESLWANW